MSGWKPEYVMCGAGKLTGKRPLGMPDHPIISTDGVPAPCLICQLFEDNRDLKRQVCVAAAMLHEGKVVQAHQVLMGPPLKEEPDE